MSANVNDRNLATYLKVASKYGLLLLFRILQLLHCKNNFAKNVALLFIYFLLYELKSYIVVVISYPINKIQNINIIIK